MQKNAKILIVALAIIGVSVPSLYFGINAYLDSQMENVSVTIVDFKLTDMDGDSMDLELNLTISTEVEVSVDFHLASAELSYDGVTIGTIAITDNSFTSTTASYVNEEMIVTITNAAKFNEFLSAYINDASVQVAFSGDVVFDSPPVPLSDYEITKTVSLEGLNGLPGMVTVEVDFITLTLTPSAAIEVNTTVTITNPTEYSFDITAFEGDLKFDDDDGYDTLPFNYPPKDGVVLDQLDIDWSSAPVELTPGSSTEKNQTLQDSTLNEVTVRVYDEYLLDNDLELYITDGVATIELFGNEITVTGLSVAKFPVDSGAG